MLPYYQHQWEGAFEIYGTDPFSMLLAPSMTSLKMAIRMSPIQKSAENHILLQQHGHQALSRQGPIILHPQRILSDAKTYKVTCKCIVSTNCYCSHITGSLFGPVKPRSKIQCGDKRRTICRACVHGDLPGSVWNLIVCANTIGICCVCKLGKHTRVGDHAGFPSFQFGSSISVMKTVLVNWWCYRLICQRVSFFVVGKCLYHGTFFSSFHVYDSS